MTYRSLTPTPANIPTSPATARSYARITRPILTLSGPRAKTEAEILAAAAREANPPDFTAKPAGRARIARLSTSPHHGLPLARLHGLPPPPLPRFPTPKR